MEDNNLESYYEELEKLILSQIDEVRSVLKDEHGIDVPPECDDFIARCLRLKDGNFEKTIKLIIAYKATIKDFKNWDAKLQPSSYEGFFQTYQVAPLVQRDRQNRKVIVFRLSLWDPHKFNFDQTVLATWMVGDHLHKESIDAQRNGLVAIVDFSNFTLQQAWHVRQWRLLSLAKWATNGVAGRNKAIHVVNPSRIAKVIYAAIRPFLKEKLKQRIFFHDNLSCLHEYFDPRNLPNFLGGELDPAQDECVDKAFIKDLLLEDDHYKDVAERSLPRK